jgi:hypothetical protein
MILITCIIGCVIIGLFWNLFQLNKKLSKIEIELFEQNELEEYCNNKDKRIN